MSVRYPSLAHRKQTTRVRERQLAADVATIAAEGFEQQPVSVDREPPPWPPTQTPGRVDVFDLDTWTHPGRTVASIGPYLVLCGICTNHPGHFDLWADAETAQRTHYTTHHNAGETS